MKKAEQITVLMYHRVDRVDTDPWGICVAPHLFEEQIQYLTSKYPVISIAEAVQQATTGNMPEHSICITFDDGYADNYAYAKPILKKYNCPATFFIPTAFIGASEPFWWDELEYLFLHLPQLPSQLQISINEKAYDFTLSSARLTSSQWQQHQNWKWYEEPPTDRCTVFLAVWESLRPLPQAAIQQHLTILKKWAGSSAPSHFRLPINSQQLQTLFENPLFTAGLHTHTHPDLSTKEKQVQLKEIESGQTILRDQYNLHSSYLAYPYGRYNEASLQAVKELNITACFTTEASAIHTGSNLTTLGRYQAGNWDKNEFKKQLFL